MTKILDQIKKKNNLNVTTIRKNGIFIYEFINLQTIKLKKLNYILLRWHIF